MNDLDFAKAKCHLETASPFTVPCKGREARFLYHSRL